MLLQSFGDGHETPDEHPGVPAILAVAHIFERLVEVRLLHEPLRAIKRSLIGLRSLRRRQRLADPNVTVAGRWFGGLDADGHNRLAATGEIETII